MQCFQKEVFSKKGGGVQVLNSGLTVPLPFTLNIFQTLSYFLLATIVSHEKYTVIQIVINGFCFSVFFCLFINRLWCVWAWISLGFSFHLRFTKPLAAIGLCFSLNLGSFQPVFLQIFFFSAPHSFCFISGCKKMKQNVKPSGVVP